MHFEELFKRLSPKLKGIVYKLKRQNLFLGEEDLFQEALFHLWKNDKSGLLQDKTDSYILQGCYFHLKNYIRSHTRKVSLVSLYTENFEPGDENLVDTLPDAFNDSAYLDSLSDKLLAETIQNNGLEPREKEILAFYARGFTIRQIGQRLGISHVRVLKLTRRIREKCYKYLDNL